MYTYIIIILFFGSLASIMVMVGRKLALIKNGEAIVEQEMAMPAPFPYLRGLRHHGVKNIKKYGHLTLVETIRAYVRSVNFLKNIYRDVQTNIENRIRKSHIEGERKEISKFLKIIGEYKRKIRRIKHQIHEEEKGL